MTPDLLVMIKARRNNVIYSRRAIINNTSVSSGRRWFRSFHWIFGDKNKNVEYRRVVQIAHLGLLGGLDDDAVGGVVELSGNYT